MALKKCGRSTKRLRRLFRGERDSKNGIFLKIPISNMKWLKWGKDASSEMKENCAERWTKLAKGWEVLPFPFLCKCD